MTIFDIAAMANVSKSTVSRVLNNPDAVRPEVVRRVREAMKESGYAPAAVRRGPKPRPPVRAAKTGSIGLLLLGRTRELLAFPSMANIVSGMVETLSANGLHLTVIEVPDPLVLPSIVSPREVDGILVMGRPPTQSMADRLHPIPCVWQGGVELDVPVADQVLANSRVIGRLAADYLSRKGCRRPAYLNHDPFHVAFSMRWMCFVDRLGQAGMSPQRFEPTPSPNDEAGKWAAEVDMWSATRLREGLIEQVDRMLAAPERPDGLFIPTDQQAAMVWSLLRDRGVTPGRDLVTISVNNEAVWLDALHPRPATIDPGNEEMGREAVRRLLGRIERPHDDPVTVMVAPKLIEGV